MSWLKRAFKQIGKEVKLVTKDGLYGAIGHVSGAYDLGAIKQRKAEDREQKKASNALALEGQKRDVASMELNLQSQQIEADTEAAKLNQAPKSKMPLYLGIGGVVLVIVIIVVIIILKRKK